MKQLCSVWLFITCVAGFAFAAGDRAVGRPAVSIENLQYKPLEITVKRGDTVVWTNNDDRDHTVIAKDGSFRSRNIKSGEIFEHTFTKSGRFAYGCTYHPRMKGLVIVSDP